jgi:hypothetical protein
VPEIVIHSIPEYGTDPEEAAADLESYLRDIDGVEPVLVEVEHPQIGPAEVLTVIQVASATIDLVEKLISFVKSRQAKGAIKDIQVEIDGQRIPVASLTPEQRSRLTAALADGT